MTITSPVCNGNSQLCFVCVCGLLATAVYSSLVCVFGRSDIHRCQFIYVAGPTLDDVTNAVCPDSQPYKCLPYGSCYGPDSYCHRNSYSVESCFPHELSTDESKLAYCQAIYQNVSKLLNPTCQYACMTLPQRPDISAVCESHSDVLIRLYAAIAVIIVQFVVIIWLCMPCSYKKKIYQSVTFKWLKYQDARADGYAPAAVTEDIEKTENPLQIRISDDHVVNVPQETDVDVRGTTQIQIQIQNQHQQPNQTQQLVENTNGSTQLQQPPLTSSGDEVPQSYPSSGNDSAMSSPASSPSVSSVSTNDDSGVSSGRDGHIDHMNLVQEASQPQVLINQNGDFNQQSSGERRADIQFYTNASIPDQESKLVTSLSQYKRD